MSDFVVSGFQAVSGSAGLGEVRHPQLPRRAEWEFNLKLYAATGGAPSFARPGRQPDSLSDPHWHQLFEHAIGVSLRPGHTIGCFRNGSQIFPPMLRSIESARRSIEFLFFVYWGGDVAQRFCDALVARAEAGVRVRVLLDGVGSAPMPRAIRRTFDSSPVELRVFHPIPHWKFWGTASRTHRKILVVDGELGFTGGVGIAEEWTGDADRPDRFRDTQFELTGPAVAELRAAFHANWAASGGRLPDPLDVPLGVQAGPQPSSQLDSQSGLFAGSSAGSSVGLSAEARASSVGIDQRSGLPGSSGDGCRRLADVRCGVLAATSAEECSEIALLFQLLVTNARSTLDIVTPYFVPGPALCADLCAAARRGVDVRIMASGRQTDHRLPRWAGHRYYQRLLDAGVELLEYDGTLQHSKALIVDQRIVCVGSPNMNQRSMCLDDEIALIALDRGLADALLDDFGQDCERCRRIDPDQWPSRGLWRRLRARWASIFEAQL